MHGSSGRFTWELRIHDNRERQRWMKDKNPYFFVRKEPCRNDCHVWKIFCYVFQTQTLCPILQSAIFTTRAAKRNYQHYCMHWHQHRNKLSYKTKKIQIFYWNHKPFIQEREAGMGQTPLQRSGWRQMEWKQIKDLYLPRQRYLQTDTDKMVETRKTDSGSRPENYSSPVSVRPWMSII